MKACMVAYTFYETDNRVRRYAEALVKRGDQVDAIALRRPGQLPFEVIRGVHVYRIQNRVIDESSPVTYLTKLLAFFYRSARMLAIHHWRQPYDLVHVHSVPDFEVFSTIVPKLLGAKVILDIHDIVPELYASKFKMSHSSIVFRLLVLMERFSIRYAGHVIVANHLWHERLIRRSARAESCTTILNYPDPQIFSGGGESTDRDPDKFVICYPGTLSWHQGVDLIVKALASLRDKAPNLQLVIFGDGPERANLERLVKEHSLCDRVSISGGVAMEVIAEAMTRADLGVEPKRKDSFGNEALSTKILEFMAMDVPVLASDTLINQRYFGGGLVEFFESDDVAGLAESIWQLMHDSARRMVLRDRGLKHIQMNNWLKKKHEYFEIVDGLLRPSVEAVRGVSWSKRMFARHRPAPRMF